MEFQSSFSFNPSSFHGNKLSYRSEFPYQKVSSCLQENLKLPHSDQSIIVQGSSSQFDPFSKSSYCYDDPFLQASQNFCDPPPHNQNYFLNKNAFLSSNLMPSADSMSLSFVNNQSQSILNFQGSSSVSVNPFVTHNRPSDDQRIRNRIEVERVRRHSGRVHWNLEEDRKLMQLVEQYGTKKWSHIAQLMPGKVGKQLRDRYTNHLKPGLKKEPWAKEEDVKLIEAHVELGNKWAQIARRIPGRTECDIKNRWNATKKKCLNAIKKSRTNPKPSSLFEDYMKKLLTERKANSSSRINGESNEFGGPSLRGSNDHNGSVYYQISGNGLFDGDDRLVGLPSSSGPSFGTDDDYSLGQFGNMGYVYW